MTKLTTERLEKLQDNLLQFQDAYSDPADKENYDIFVDALHVIDEFKIAKEKILAYEQAAKNPVAWVATDSEGFPEYNGHNEFSSSCGAGTPLYAAPVLPKQPELVENLKKVMNSWLAMEPKLAYQPEFTDVMMLLDAEAAPAQPVILEQPESEIPFGDVEPIEVTDDMVYAFHNQLSDSALGSDEFTDIKHGLCAALMNIPRPAQPVIPDNDGGDLIQRLCGRAQFLRDRGEVKTPELIEAAISALSAQPVSEPYKLNGWISVDNELPEEGVRVLVFSDGAFVLLAEFTGGEFYDVVRDGEEFFETVTRCVTHWMPLPAAPAQESE